jgi:hypothetical protein
MPWDESVCDALGEYRHAGGLGCRVDSAFSARWNREAPAAWRRLHRRAYQETVRRCGPGSVLLLARVWELQARGLLHVHPELGYETAAQMAGARAYLARLAELAPQYGLGKAYGLDDCRRARPRNMEQVYIPPIPPSDPGAEGLAQGGEAGCQTTSSRAPASRARLGSCSASSVMGTESATSSSTRQPSSPAGTTHGNTSPSA